MRIKRLVLEIFYIFSASIFALGMMYCFYQMSMKYLGAVSTCVIMYVVFGVGNNLGVAQMSYMMPGFPSFLNYSPQPFRRRIFGSWRTWKMKTHSEQSKESLASTKPGRG